MWLISLSFFFVFAGFNSAQQYLTVFFEREGHEQLALISLLILYTVFMATGIFISKVLPFFGTLKRALMIGAATYALFCLAVACNTPLVLLIASAVIGFGAGLMWVSSSYLIADTSSASMAGRNFAYQTVGQFGGMIAGMFVAAYLFELTSFVVAYIIFAIEIAIGIALMSGIRPVRERAEIRAFRPLFILDTRMLALLPLLTGTSFVLAELGTAINFVVIAALGAAALPLVIGASRFGSMIGTFIAGTLADRYSKQSVLASLVVIALLAQSLVLLKGSFPIFLIGCLTLGLTVSAVFPVVLAYLKVSMPHEEYAYAIGAAHAYNTFGFVVALIANLFLSARASFVPGALILIVGLVAIFFLKNQRYDASYAERN